MNARRATPLLAAAMVLAAASFGIPALYVPGFALLLAFAVARTWVRLAAMRARLEVEPGPRTVIEGQPYPLRLRVSRGGLPLPDGTVTHPLAANAVPIDGDPAELEITSLRRGRRRIEPATLVVADPLGLSSTGVRATSDAAVLVLPRIEDLLARTAAVNGGEDAVPGAAQSHGAGLGKRAIDFEVDGLRAYRPGTPASRIHWPILARTGELVERRLVGGADASPVIVMDAERPVDSDALDRAVRAAASLCFHLAPLRGCLLVLPGDRVPVRIDRELRTWPQAHARLALVEACASPPDPRTAQVAGAVIWVSANGAIPRPSGNLSAGSAYLVTATPVDLDPPTFTVAGCDGHRLQAQQARSRVRAA
jgi:uncharacterized protein (DUF58 family)